LPPDWGWGREVVEAKMRKIEQMVIGDRWPAGRILHKGIGRAGCCAVPIGIASH